MKSKERPIFNKLLLSILLLMPLISISQSKDRLSRAYIGAQLHQDQPGFSLTNSFGLNKYLGIGAGVDLTSFKSEILVPVYLDIRGRYSFGKWEPFIYGQLGKNLYKKEDAIKYIDATGQAYNFDLNGRLFYGIGAGAAYNLGRIGLFLSYTFRAYQYKYGESRDVAVEPARTDEAANVLTFGLMF